ncbi:MAG: hypothetical protein VB875_17595 [Pirellulales bacterium]
MSIKFHCPNGHLLQARDDKVGKKLRCPACKQIVTVPEEGASADATELRKQSKRIEGDDLAERRSKSKSPSNSRRSKKKPPPSMPANPTAAKTPRRKQTAASGPKPAKKRPAPEAASRPAAKPPPLPDAAAKGPPSLPKPADKRRTAEPPADRPAAKQTKLKTAKGGPKRTGKRENKRRQQGAAAKTLSQSTVPTTVADTSPPSISEAWSVAVPPVQSGIFKWFGFREAASGYRPDIGKVTTVRWLALFLAVIAILGAIPAFIDKHHFYIWAHAILFISVLQLLYVFWMFTMPDWSTVWVLMLVFAVTAAVYGFGLAMTFLMPIQSALPFELQPVRESAPIWCAVMLLFTFLGAFLCGRYSFRWYRAYVLAARSD